MRIQAKETVTDGSQRYAVVEPNRYLAVVDKLEATTFKSHKGVTYLKFIPHVRLLNDQETLINREDIVVGAFNKTGLYRPDGDATKSALFGDARNFLAALKLGTGDNLDFDTDHIYGRVVRVVTNIAGYQRKTDDTPAASYTPEELASLLGKPSFEKFHETLAAYNEENGTSIQPKNVIVSYFAPRDFELEEAMVVDPASGAVFENDAVYDKFLNAADDDDIY